MKTEDFYYRLPESLIAQKPSNLRDHSRMMVVDRRKGTVELRYFYEISEFFERGDTLVINDSRVIPARLFGTKSTGATIEILLLTKHGSPKRWEVLLRPAKRVRIGTEISFNDGASALVAERRSEKKWILDFYTEGDFDLFLERNGRAPLPPYIKREKGGGNDNLDQERYQTVYAIIPGSVAAPTAGLHFSEEILEKLEKRGVDIVKVTLHVGYGTFLPIETDNIEDHVMEEECYEISPGASERIAKAGRITATGTTSVRVLESATGSEGKTSAGLGYTNLFIYPGYSFKKVNRLITNFHLPKSSLYLLVCAFAGKELIEKAYKIAVDEGFRFYSYGDCMLIV
ncbi:MAG: tRNA preQ1(34) S-adenosylmethionine ribosyltransferase-isomerase QueA [Deltaproteobacteria bacterium]|nr:tRNA preQ1(34) S-adenosylmethionine ribosyltransferase-isomerase QueA [Deltaproteobacteria bacterium]MBN2844732.1 tRNA preQ1(34) S-adenosylmethionine ribosyltransferase-isomerase QueA [Deltaproteobacteria bacterium]